MRRTAGRRREGAPARHAAGEQQIDKLATEWTTDNDGMFMFHAADDAVFEATHGAQRGWARLDGNVAITHA